MLFKYIIWKNYFPIVYSPILYSDTSMSSLETMLNHVSLSKYTHTIVNGMCLIGSSFIDQTLGTKISCNSLI